MSKTTLVVTGLVLAGVGFGAGHYVGSSAGLREAPLAAPTNVSPLPPGEDGNALLEAMTEPDLLARMRRLANLLDTLGPEAIPDVREALEAPLRTEPHIAEAGVMLAFWAKHDPEAATRWIFNKGGRGHVTVAAAPAIELWAGKDPKAAVQFLLTSGNFGESNQAQKALVRGWFESGLPGLEEYIRDLGMGVEQQRAMSILARQKIARDGAESTLRWVESLPDEPRAFKLAGFRFVASELGKVDPLAAAAWCDKVCEGPFGSNVRERVAATWARQDPLAAMKWVSESPAGPERDKAVRAAFMAWQIGDQEGLREFVSAMDVESVEPWFLPNAGPVAVWLAWENGEEAVKWAELAPENSRELVLVTVARRWREWDREAADAWLDQSPLSEEARKKARKIPYMWKVRRGEAERERVHDDEEPS